MRERGAEVSLRVGLQAAKVAAPPVLPLLLQLASAACLAQVAREGRERDAIWRGKRGGGGGGRVTDRRGSIWILPFNTHSRPALSRVPLPLSRPLKTLIVKLCRI